MKAIPLLSAIGLLFTGSAFALTGERMPEMRQRLRAMASSESCPA